MVRHILFSENEAFKLKAFIERARLFLPNVDLHILVKASDMHQQAYEQVIAELAIENVNFTDDAGFHETAIRLIEQGDEKLTCLLTTDDMLFSHVDESLIIKEFDDQNLFAFSLRLGKNITFNSMVKMSNKVIPISENDLTMKWDWTKHYVDFSAPLSVHGHYFKKDVIRKMVRSCKAATGFAELEELLQRFMNFPKPLMASFVESKAVSINPIFDASLENYVKETFDNMILRHGNISIVTDYSLVLPSELHAPLLESQIRDAVT